jgi:dihydroorotate dehydrogenase
MIYPLLRPLLFALDAETAHRAAVTALMAGIYPRAPAPDPSLARTLMGLRLPNPVGLAPGFDKNGEVVDACLALGFGFVEVGGVTPKPQPGNPRPRIFRSPVDGAIVNRFGFNSEGHEAVYARLAARERRGIVGVNLGANKDSEDRAADFVAGIKRFADVASFLVVNVSSPNTPGLRDLQERDALARLLGRVAEAREAQAKKVPILVKIAPDLDSEALAAIANVVATSGMEGMIVSNTTLSRDGITDPAVAKESGGMSGRPLFARSTALLAETRRLVGDKLVLIGAGGIDSAATARAKFAAGADLVQLYTGMVYQGPGLAADIVADLARKRT